MFPLLSGDIPSFSIQPYSTEQVIMAKTIKEEYSFQQPSRFDFITFRMTTEAMGLLNATTENRHGERISNLTLFYDLLSRMAVLPKVSNDFRRPLALQPGQAQYSELRLTEQWRMNRTRMRNLLDRMEQSGLIYTHRSLIGSVMSFPSVMGWIRPGKPYTVNPIYSSHVQPV